MTGTLEMTEQDTALVRFLWAMEETVATMEEALEQLQREGTNLELIEKLYYLAYRLREGALLARLDEVSQLARVLENVFEHARRGQVDMTSDLISLLVPSCGALRRMTAEAVGGAEGKESSGETPESDVIDAAVS